MFGKKRKREQAELRAELVRLAERLDAMQRELVALREESSKRRTEEKEKKSQAELEAMWLYGEKGDGV